MRRLNRLVTQRILLRGTSGKRHHSLEESCAESTTHAKPWDQHAFAQWRPAAIERRQLRGLPHPQWDLRKRLPDLSWMDVGTTYWRYVALGGILSQSAGGILEAPTNACRSEAVDDKCLQVSVTMTVILDMTRQISDHANPEKNEPTLRETRGTGTPKGKGNQVVSSERTTFLGEQCCLRLTQM